MKLSDIKPNPNNPRIIKDESFKQLCNSLQEFPKMMKMRPIVIDENNMIMGGNMRFKALIELGYKEIPDEWVRKYDDLTAEEKQEFIIKDNVGFGQWNWEQLQSDDWDIEKLNSWGLDIYKTSEINLDDFFKENNNDKDLDEKKKIILEYTNDDYERIIEAFKSFSGTKEQIILNLLGL